MNSIKIVGYPTKEKGCLCKDKFGHYVIAYPYINSLGKFLFWEYTEEMVDPQDITEWIYIDNLNLEV